MKVTKYVHSCLLVEMPDPVNKTALFDPGTMSESAVPVERLTQLDNIIITHSHPDHFSVPLVKALVGKFPDVHITAPQDVVKVLQQEGIRAYSDTSEGVEFFESPHASVRPYVDADPPQQIGVHYHNKLTHPGDSHHFRETKPVLALPVQGPWGSTVAALQLAITLQPRYVLPIHDWHWSMEARQSMYQNIQKALAGDNITFLPLETGRPVDLDV